MHPTLRLPGLGLAALCALTACSSGSNPAGPEDPPPGPGPGPITESRWDLDVTVRYVKASRDETCDGKTIFGVVNPGEFQFRVVGSFGSRTETLETFDYGSIAGISHMMAPEEINNFTNQTWTFNNLREGQGVELRLYATEWDVSSRDSDLNNRSSSVTITPSALLPSGGTRIDRAVGVGDARCGLTLYHDVTVRLRTVTTG